MEQRWHVIQTKVQQEQLAVHELTKQRFKTFFPIYAQTRINKQTKMPMQFTLPLFPSYIFALFNPDDQHWMSINGTRGVTGLIGIQGNYVSPIPRGYVEELYSRRDDRGYIRLEQAVEDLLQLKRGDPVEITDGAFAGQVASYCNHSGNRVQLFLTLLNRPTRVILPISAIRLNPA